MIYDKIGRVSDFLQKKYHVSDSFPFPFGYRETQI